VEAGVLESVGNGRLALHPAIADYGRARLDAAEAADVDGLPRQLVLESVAEVVEEGT
jgi:hypothetical protein